MKQNVLQSDHFNGEISTLPGEEFVWAPQLSDLCCPNVYMPRNMFNLQGRIIWQIQVLKPDIFGMLSSLELVCVLAPLHMEN